MIQTAHYACRVNLARFSIKWKEARSLSEDACSGLSRANLRRRGRCGSPLKFLHVQARPREIKFNGVSDEDLSYSRTRVYTIHAYTQGCTRCSMRKKPASRICCATLAAAARGHIISIRVYIYFFAYKLQPPQRGLFY